MTQPPERTDVDRLIEALDAMPRLSRIAFLLHARRGLSVDRIARRLGISRRRLRRVFVKAIEQIDRACRDRPD